MAGVRVKGTYAMKTYTIRPLEWKATQYGEYADVPFGTYHVGVKGVGAFWCFDPQGDFDDVDSDFPPTIAAAKELAWQDWLRRITPVMEEIK